MRLSIRRTSVPTSSRLPARKSSWAICSSSTTCDLRLGLNAAYFVYPILLGLIDATAYFAQAAKDARLDGVVNMSQISARYELKSHAARDHWIAERVFDWSGIPVTHIRPTFFAQWLTYPHIRKPILERGVISQPLGDGRHAPIAAEDQARLIAAILADPVAHKG